jgi:hypothetical protein
MAEWSEDHVAAIGPFKLEPWNLCLMSDKMETGRSQLGGPVEHLEGKAGKVLWLFWGFCVVALACVG